MSSYSVRTLLFLIAAVIWVMSVTLVSIGGDHISDLERHIFALSQQGPDWLSAGLHFLTNSGYMIIISVFAIFALRTVRIRLLLMSLLALASAWWVSDVLKVLFDRGRPAEVLQNFSFNNLFPELMTNGFPSGHAASSAAWATVVALQVPLRWSWVAIVAAVVIGYSRLHLGAHLPLDVLGGWALGLVIGFMVQLAGRYIIRAVNKRKTVYG